METIDNYKEHGFHKSYHTDCSECFKERRILQAFRTVNHNKLREELGITNESALRGGLFGRGTPWDRNPLEN